MKKLLVLLALAFIGGFLGYRLYAQSLPVSIIVAPTGSTLANCGTPTLPSICVVAPGVYVWQNATQGWFLLAPAVAAGVSSVTVCNAAGTSCSTAQTGAVSINVPKSATATAPSVSLQ
jgi:hypothetical protein